MVFSLNLLIPLGLVAYASAQAVVASHLPMNWTYYGCFTEGNGIRALDGASYTNSTGMTEQSCIGFCMTKGFIFSGVEYADECYCGNEFQGGSSNTTATDCNMACSGNSTELCGAGNRLTVFWNGTDAPPPPVTNPGVDGWVSIGCYTDNVNNRTLVNGLNTPGGANNLTIALCTKACNASGYTYAGTEYSGECYCDNAIEGAGVPATSGCAMTCNGNASEFCGGPSRLNVYHLGPLSSSSASSASSTSSTSSTPVKVPPTTTSTTASTTLKVWSTHSTSTSTSTSCTHFKCVSTSTSSTHSKSTSKSTSSTSTSKTTSTKTAKIPSTTSTTSVGTTTTATSTNSTAIITTSTSIASNTSNNMLTSTSVTTTSAAATGLPTGFVYEGCWVDNQYGGRILEDQLADNSTMTIESCVNGCVAAGYTIAGIEYSTQCFCGNLVQEGGYKSSTDSDCNMACGGNANEICGGPNRMSLYSNSSITAIAPPSTQNASLPGNWKYAGCVSEGQGVRALPYQLILTNNNSAEACLTQCSNYGYPYGGMEYGDECYCGDLSDLTAANSTSEPETDCNIICSGNASYICGGGNRISLYKWSGDPLYVWNYPQGNAAGSYEFFMPGVVVPLITMNGKNGKITFVEKYGTSEFDNSTGAYELDPSLAPDFPGAWRQMTGLKTDVFCSAGLILPDLGARHINVGGWSGTSTYGIRFYTPDGSLGVNGTNQWEENYQEIALQAGRWYPSAMLMTNGSILVVGGESGSNASPTPSLELLPQAGPTLYCDWLERTDPNNLYPFLTVLPSGGILVIYYNEARILDAGSLQTIKTLPNLPGAVNNNGSGRTYPLEGTTMLMPQHAPYSDPLTVLVCGGSNTGAAIALDNCVSTQPDAANPKWTLERMPSKRVMSCIVALPDGTYLILNGAHQGVAGFGLATDPNYNAVLYDPTQPSGQRMSVMANTTIARLYHSEAILLDDGRVLVSGSDPQDGVHPEEMRVEVFNPPYILSGQARPSFDLNNNNTDWTYGENVPFTVAVPSGNAGNVKVSLMGAVASTHGNSMGQRTIFPAFSCSGSTCTVTAPPNVNVCPPGWFQMFVLDGAMPSTASWVRIGGDPGQLGEWPSFPDFTRPGS